jgi:spermidine synthase
MNTLTRRALFLFFFFSGFCSLLYQVVWLRLAMSAFGVITPVLSIVVSVFMLGLALGSWIGGKIINPLIQATQKSALLFYAFAELMIGVGAFLVPQCFHFGEICLRNSSQSDSLSYLIASASIISISLLPWCFFMGITLPFIMAFVKQQNTEPNNSFSFFYLANVLGGMAGTLISSFVLIELIGFSWTIRLAGIINILIALSVLFLNRFAFTGRNHTDENIFSLSSDRKYCQRRHVLLILFTTGFVSLALEVIWTRVYTPILGTQVYAFASLLFVYLLATYFGSMKYRTRKNLSHPPLSIGNLLALLAGSILLPLIVNDPRFLFTTHYTLSVVFFFGRPFLALVSIFPLCSVLGYLTPSLIDEYSKGDPRLAGKAYALNTIGCILGPLAAAYFILPFMGAKNGQLFLSIPIIALPFLFWDSFRNCSLRGCGFASIPILVLAFFFSKSYEDYPSASSQFLIRRDHTATVIAYGSGMEKVLLVNGIGMTKLTTVTKAMAHFPMAVHAEKPSSALVICFGMGTTYRAFMSWGVDVTAVELVPSVKASFGYFFSDADQILKNSKGKIIIDDGRRYLARINSAYDVITIDPPPPPEAAGSSLLYSIEFYDLVKQRLKVGGILQQWLPSDDSPLVFAVTRSLTSAFPFVRAFRSVEGWGYHFLASTSPLKISNGEELSNRMPVFAQMDFVEWNPEKNCQSLFELMISSELPIHSLLSSDLRIVITDDSPFNEYFFLRRI